MSTVLKISHKNQLIIGAALIALMVLSRSNLFSHLADASWSIFFMVGFYLTHHSIRRLAFPVFFLLAFIIDLLVIDAQGGVHYCFTPSYPFLIPAYATMYFAGRWFTQNYEENVRGLFKFATSAVVAVAVCFFISNLGFYFFAGKFENMSLLQYSNSVAQYLPGYLKTTVVYLSTVGIFHLIINYSRKPVGSHSSST